ncbi:MAG TPA: hypothetical protein VFF27_00260 [Bacteroidia bacterium]|nr:hypothetical protein [Bacteroidia bacterium]
MENKRLITILGIVFLVATILFAGVPALLDFILILKDKKQDYTFKHNYYILGGGLITGLLMVLSPNTIVSLINRFASSKLPKE